MITVIDDEWLVDTEAMLCSNNLTRIVVEFVRSGNTYIGKIKEMPMELTTKLSKMKNGDKLLQKAVMDAEEVFMKEMFTTNEEVEMRNVEQKA